MAVNRPESEDKGGLRYSYSTVARDLWSITTPSPRAQPEGKGVVIDHKSHGYRAITITYPTSLAKNHARAHHTCIA